jgi:hypothetical protein
LALRTDRVLHGLGFGGRLPYGIGLFQFF